VVSVGVPFHAKFLALYQANKRAQINAGNNKKQNKNKTQIMSEVKKLTTEELQSIKDMQQQFNKFVFELGSVEAQLQNLLATKVLIETEKSNVLEDIKKLSDREKEVVSTLQGKYGIGNIDIETGDITPFPQAPQA
jgi:hypothetical protein